jgi:hypothetical protein
MSCADAGETDVLYKSTIDPGQLLLIFGFFMVEFQPLSWAEGDGFPTWGGFVVALQEILHHFAGCAAPSLAFLEIFNPGTAHDYRKDAAIVATRAGMTGANVVATEISESPPKGTRPAAHFRWDSGGYH